MDSGERESGSSNSAALKAKEESEGMTTNPSPQPTPSPTREAIPSPSDQSATIGALAAALAKAQGAMTPAKKESDHPHFRHKYADLASVWDAIRKPLSDNGLAVLQTTRNTKDGDVLVITTLAHGESGEWIKGSLTIKPVKADPQGIGSALTYARRYSLAAIVGVAPDDDDGEAAMGRAQPTQGNQKPPVKQNQRQQATRQQSRPAQPQQRREPVQGTPITEKQVKAIWAISKGKGVDPHHVAAQVVGHPVGSLNELSLQEAGKIIDHLNGKRQQDPNPADEPPNPF